MVKTKKIKKERIKPLAVANIEKHIVFFCLVENAKEADIFLCERSRSGFKKIESIEIFSEKGEMESLKGCENFHAFNSGQHWYLVYSRKYRKFFSDRRETVIARSLDFLHFEVIDRDEHHVFDTLAAVSRDKHKNRFLAYSGNGSISAAASHDLKNWHFSGKLLSPRKDHFDSGSLHPIDALSTKRGILVLYQSRKRGSVISMGGALFSLNHPYKLVWRSEEPLWEKTLDKEAYPLRYLGCVFEKDTLHTYWFSKDNKLVSKKIATVSAGIGSIAKRPIHLSRHHANPIIKAKAENSWEYDATFNPAAVHLDDKVHLLYRAIGANGVSVFGYASSSDGFSVNERLDHPAFAAMDFSQYAKEDQALYPSRYVSGGSWIGCEDPRLTRIEDRIYMTYTSFDGCNPPGVTLTWISVQDFLRKKWTWKRPVLISKPGEIQKNWMLFPEKINGKYAILHSITPRISIEYVDDLEKEGLVIESKKEPGKDDHRWDNIVRGAGAPPIRTEHGWLVFYHAMSKKDPNRYKVGAMILDNDDPTKVLYRANCPVLEPDAQYENEGAKAGVVYVCGTVIKDGTLFVYYGGADSVVCVATADVDAFLQDMIQGAIKEHASEKKSERKKKKIRLEVKNKR